MNSAIIAIVFAVGYYAVAIFMVRKTKFTPRDLCICSIVIAMTVILEFIYVPLPTGGTIPLCSPVPLMLLAILVDYRLAFFSGWIVGLLAMMFIPGWQLVHWGQFFVEHMVCFSCLGFAGIFGNDKRWKILCGIALASLVKIIGHFVSGIVFFAQNAWDGWGAFGYSFIYNTISNLPLCIVSAIIIMALPLNNIKRAIGKEMQ